MVTGIGMLLASTFSPAVHASDCTPPSPTATSYMADGCDATISGGTFDTGSSAYASVLHALNGGSITVTGPVTLHSGGDNSTGAYADDGGLIRLDARGSVLTMLGAHSNGVHAFGSATITGQVEMTTYGLRAHAAFADYGGEIHLHDSIITTHGAEAAGVTVATGSFELLGTSSITTTGDLAPGVVQTWTNSSVVLDARGGRITVHTTGRESPGAAADTAGTIVLRGVDVLTEGVGAIGLLSTAAGTAVDAGAGSAVATRGDLANALQSVRGGSIFMTGGVVSTGGLQAHGLLAADAGSQVLADGTLVRTSGPGSHALYAHNGASVELRNGVASATGAGGSGLYLVGDTATTIQRATLTASTLTSSQAAAIRVAGGTAIVQISGGAVTGNGLWLDVSDTTVPARLDLTASGTLIRGASHVASVANVSLRDGAIWLVSGDSTLTRLENLGSTVAFVPPERGVFHALSVKHYHGDGGTLALTAALGGDESSADRLVIDGGIATGTTNVRIVNAGGKGALTSAGIRVIETVNGGNAPAGTFAMVGRAVAGPYEYGLYRGRADNPADGDWYLRSQRTPIPPDPPSPPTPPQPMYRPEVPAYIANEQAAASLFLHSLHDRMGELPFSSAAAGWLRLVGRTGESGSRDNYYSARANTVIMQGGGDIARTSLFGHADRLHVGAMAGYGVVETNGLAAGNATRAKGHVNGYGIGAYATWFGHAASDLGPYVDTWLQYAWFDSNVRGDLLPQVNYHSQAWNVSVEGGWALPMGSLAWRVEPQAQAVWVRHRGVSVTEPNGTQVHGGDTDGVVTRLGARIFRTIEKEDGGRLQPYATLNWWHDQVTASVGFNDTVLGQLFPRNRYEVKLGLNAKLSRGWTSWGNIGVQRGSQGYRQYGMRLGARYAW
ncbi:MAG: autotransporter outer membrane beta-barrel domain-containing protein [Cupriavidus sp.]|nr:autotransporter outer membrane beta-barrel domain-containing protein [Cupriavidus sp.]